MTTTHYQLTLFESDDKPTWLEDWNHTMTQLDEILYRISSGGGDLPDLSEVVARLQALEARVDSDELEINEIQGYISTIQADITAINETISGIQSDISSVQSDVLGLNSNFGTLSETVGTLSTSLSSLSARVGTAENNISGLDTRVTALENSGGGVTFVNQGKINTFKPSTLANLVASHDLTIITSGTSVSNGIYGTPSIIFTKNQGFSFPTSGICDFMLFSRRDVLLGYLRSYDDSNFAVSGDLDNNSNNLPSVITIDF